MCILNYALYTQTKYLRILSYAVYTQVTKIAILLSSAWRIGVASLPIKHARVLKARRAWKSGIIGGSGYKVTLAPPPKTQLGGQVIHTEILLRDLRELRFAKWFGIHTVNSAYIEVKF